MIKISLEIDSDDISKLNIPSIIKALTGKNGSGYNPKKQDNVPDYVKEYVYRIVASFGRPAGIKEIVKETEFKHSYVLRILRFLIQDGKVAGKWFDNHQYRYYIVNDQKKQESPVTVTDLGTVPTLTQQHHKKNTGATPAERTRYVSVSKKAKRNVIEAFSKTEEPLTVDALLRKCAYCLSYTHKIIQVLLDEGLLEPVAIKTGYAYKLKNKQTNKTQTLGA